VGRNPTDEHFAYFAALGKVRPLSVGLSAPCNAILVLGEMKIFEILIKIEKGDFSQSPLQ
jgi:hypothetical protein